MRLARALMIALVCFGATGFGILYSPRNLKNDLPPGAGRIVIATGVAHTCFSRAMSLHMGAVTNNWSWNQAMSVQIDTLFLNSDYPDHLGTLHTKVVKAGELELYAAYLGVNSTQQTPRYLVTVGAGETVYVGEYWLYDSCSGANYGDFRDEHMRDIELLKTLSPALAQTPVITRLPVRAGWKINASG